MVEGFKRVLKTNNYAKESMWFKYRNLYERPAMIGIQDVAIIEQLTCDSEQTAYKSITDTAR